MVTTQHESKQIRQKQIVTAAKKLIVRHGSEHVTIRRMAGEIGVTEAAIYRHFKSKKEILYFLLDDVEKSLTTGAERNGGDGSDYLAILDSLFRRQISNTQQKRGVTFQIIAEIISLGDRQLNKRAYEVITKFISQIKDVLSNAIKSGSVRTDIDPEVMAVLLFGMVQGLVSLWALSRYSINLEQRYRNLWGFIYQSISQN